MNTPNKQAAAIKYPVDFDLKVITGIAYSIAEQEQQIEKILTELRVPFKQWCHKASSRGNFISHTVGVHIESEQHMHSLYAALKQLPDIKMAL